MYGRTHRQSVPTHGGVTSLEVDIITMHADCKGIGIKVVLAKVAKGPMLGVFGEAKEMNLPPQEENKKSHQKTRDSSR